jgi:hypothetical protein
MQQIFNIVTVLLLLLIVSSWESEDVMDRILNVVFIGLIVLGLFLIVQ